MSPIHASKFERQVREALTPRLDGLEDTERRMRHVQSLALTAGRRVELDWGATLPHPPISEELLSIASQQSEAIDWLSTKLTLDETFGCWALPLPAECDEKGRARYPTLTSSRFGAKGELSHRFVIRRLYGPLQTEEHLDHLCRVHACCNPTHLDIVSHATNTRRGNLARRAIAGQSKLF